MSKALITRRVQEGSLISAGKIYFLPICDCATLLDPNSPTYNIRAIAFTEKGEMLGDHISESIGWLRIEFGVDVARGGYVGRYHETYKSHFPEGYEIVDLTSDDLPGTPYLANSTPMSQALHLLHRDSRALYAYEQFLIKKSLSSQDPIRDDPFAGGHRNYATGPVLLGHKKWARRR